MKILILGFVGIMILTTSYAMSSDLSDLSMRSLLNQGKTVRLTFLKEFIIEKNGQSIRPYPCKIDNSPDSALAFVSVITPDSPRRISPGRSFTIIGNLEDRDLSGVGAYRVKDDQKSTIVGFTTFRLQNQTLSAMIEACKSDFKIEVIEPALEEAHYQDSELPSNV